MTRAAVALAVVLAATLVTAAPVQERIDTSAGAVARAAGAWVTALGARLSYVVADETAHQVARTARGDTTERRTLADFFVAFLPADGAWMSARDVREVDGDPVTDAENIRVLMARAPLARLGAVIQEKNARYNIGRITRTFNEPTLALLVVTDSHRPRFNFDRVRVTARAAGPLVTLRFRERHQPTLIRGANGEWAFAEGELDVDARTGRVERSVFDVTLGLVHARITTTFRRDEALDVWAPATMTEHYERRALPSADIVDVESTYANYRRFETTTRIK